MLLFCNYVITVYTNCCCFYVFLFPYMDSLMYGIYATFLEENAGRWRCLPRRHLRAVNALVTPSLHIPAL
jgi:hypothetical protein